MGLAEKMAARQQQGAAPVLATLLDGAAAIQKINSRSVQEISIDDLHSFAQHTFKLRIGTPEMNSLIESIRNKGIAQPLIVRTHPAGGYEIIAGHTRCYAAKEVGLKTVPCIVHECDNDEAIELMAETNKQRESWLPSERAKTYQLWWDTVEKRQGTREDLTCVTRLHKLKSRDEAGEYWGLSAIAFQRYIKLNNLSSYLLNVTDEGRIVVKAAYELAFLSTDEQKCVEQLLVKYPNQKLSGGAGKKIRDAIEMERTRGKVSLELVERALGLGKAKWKDSAVSIKLTPPTNAAKIKPALLKQAMEDSELSTRIWALIEEWTNDNV